ncbi:hypothetical protein P691DRAFT_808818 [Macrolepiota fuliginosa MF-IS2]|uniref:Uncharacterized protein n=1 Tax=Macrolepiota fuliginosa MF-IS2 TaxID=1400762 RepID=A0A9P5X536_9AGAR|nr:hypothetical protein P691DRAFT_808818 [Macrolepiota fuliginosa MF-IS2]
MSAIEGARMKVIVAGSLHRNTARTVQMTGIEVALSKNVPLRTLFVTICQFVGTVACRLRRKLQKYNSGRSLLSSRDKLLFGPVQGLGCGSSVVTSARV